MFIILGKSIRLLLSQGVDVTSTCCVSSVPTSLRGLNHLCNALRNRTVQLIYLAGEIGSHGEESEDMHFDIGH